MQYVVLVWNGEPKNYLNVCFESLRLYNPNCKIYLYYDNEQTKLEVSKKVSVSCNINFLKIDKTNFKSPQYYQILKLYELSLELNENDQLLALDCDLLFQNDPFLIFQENSGDFYYSHSIVCLPDSLRPESIWKSVTYRVNAGVFGFVINKQSIKLLDFWIQNLNKPSWNKWVKYKPWNVDHAKNKWWWVDQDFINCIDNNKLPFELKRVIFSYKFNYFTSTWGFFNENLEMGSKIGNPEYAVIHFKANFKDVYNIEDPKIYNMENILAKKKLTTKKSIDTITKKFLSRGEKRFTIV